MVALGGTCADLEFRLVGDHVMVFAESGFLARVLAESMPEERVALLWPGTDPEEASTTAWDRMSPRSSRTTDPPALVRDRPPLEHLVVDEEFDSTSNTGT